MEIKQKLKKLYGECFPDKEEYVNYLFDEIYTERSVCYLECGEQISSAIYYLPRSFYFGGRLLAGAFISAVSTSENMRGRGIMKENMRAILDRLSDRPISAVFLSPANESFYKSQGFCTVFNARLTEIAPVEPFFTLKEIKNPEEFHFIKMECASSDRFSFLKSKEQNRKAFELNEKEGTRAYRVYDKDKFLGYLVDDREGIYDYSLPRESIHRVKSSGKWFIFGEGEPFTMARIIDPILFFDGARIGAEIDLCLLVEDRFLEKSYQIRLFTADGVLRCESKDCDTKIKVSIEELTKWAFGRYTGDALPEIKLIENISKTVITDRYL